MSNLSKVKVSLWSRFNASAFLAITPEYFSIKKNQSKRQDKQPTFRKLTQLPLKYKEIDGVKIRYAHEGKPNRPTIILLSPLPQSIVAYAPIWNKLKKDYNIYAYDMPGFGRSEGGEEYMNFKMQGIFLEKFINHFNIRKPHIVGPDVGMAAALYYVCNLPNEVESLIIGDGPGVSPSQNGSLINKIVKSGFWRKVFSIVGSETFVYVGSRLGYVNYQPNQEEIDDYNLSYKNRVGTITKWFKNYPDSLATVDPKLEKIDKPVLVFWGNDDKLLLPDNARNLHKKLKRSKLHIFKNCGHFSYQDKYEEFSEMLHEWISKDYNHKK